jgi:uncharacterized protein
VIDTKRVFLLGHSLGGAVAQRIAVSKPSPHWSIVRQLHDLASLDPRTADAMAPASEEKSGRARRADSPDLSASTAADDLPFEPPAPDRFDRRGYDAVAMAASLERALRISQRGRDDQVTVDDDLGRWPSRLSRRSEVEIRVDPLVNQTFLPGSGPSMAAEYEPAQHLDSAAVDDIANGLAALGKSPS